MPSMVRIHHLPPAPKAFGAAAPKRERAGGPVQSRDSRLLLGRPDLSIFHYRFKIEPLVGTYSQPKFRVKAVVKKKEAGHYSGLNEN
jgi:hypothetical protein